MSWCLRGCFQALQRPIMIPKLVRMGKMHPEVARRTASSKKAIAYWFTLTAAVSAFLAYHNVVRMTFFLVFTTLALPLFKAAAFPRVLPVPLFLCAVCYGVWRWEGVQELFLGLVLFQALPTAHETLRHFLGPKSGNLAGFVAWARRLQRRAYLALITLVMSYFETSDRLVLSMFIGSSGLIVLFYLLTQSVATESPTWICGLVAYVAALLYLIPTIRSTVLKVEDIDKISSLFEEATKQSLAGATKDDLRPVPRKLANQLLQPTGDLRQLYVMARARLKAFELEVVEPLARAGRGPTEPSRETKTSQLKKLFRAREKVAVDYGGRGERLRDVLRASIVCETVAELQTLGDELRALEAAGTVRVLQIKNRFRGHPTPSGYRDVNVSLRYHGFITDCLVISFTKNVGNSLATLLSNRAWCLNMIKS